MPKLKAGPKIVLIIAAAAGSVFGLQKAAQHGYIPTPGIMKALVPKKADLPDLADAQIKNVAPIALPTSEPAHIKNVLIRGEVWEWNAQQGLFYATGGPSTTVGSLMAKHNVNLLLTRQDDTSKMQEDLIACAKELHDGASQCSSGANFVIIMGDGSGQFAAAVDPQLKKLGPDYQLKAIGAVGYSRGEDACMLKPEAKKDPQSAKGSLVEAVLRDGDWNICMKWIGDNGLKNNPDEKTWDPDAINWVNASDYNVAAADYVAGKCEDRKVVHDGHPTGETKHVCVDGVATWTPGDVNAAMKRGGLVKVADSKLYRSQMPSTIMVIGKFARDNRDEFENMLAAIFEGGDQVKAYDKALRKSTDIAMEIYKDDSINAAYLYKYFKGDTETDPTGLRVNLGGSAVNNLADNEILFGIQPGTNDNFRSTYTVFAAIATQQYPDLFKSTPIPNVSEVEDKSFVKGAANLNDNGGGSGGAADTASYVGQDSGPVVSKRVWAINFDTGKATLTPSGLQTMAELKDSIAITGLFITIDGYTDNTGNEEANEALSQARAEAVKNFLQRSAPKNFPNDRFQVTGHGSADPVASNDTAAGKAQNRRVVITLSGN